MSKLSEVARALKEVALEMLLEQLPTEAEVVASIKGQTAFKQAYRALPKEVREALDAILPLVVQCALVKVRKVLRGA